MSSLIRLKIATTLRGTTNVVAKVKNVCYNKTVFMHYRSGTAWYDDPLPWIENFGNYDLFGRSYAPSTDEFVLFCSQGGVQDWDNNDNMNYTLSYSHTPTGDSIMLGSAIAHLQVTPRIGTTRWFSGDIFVKNSFWNKTVGVRYTADGGMTWLDCAATYQNQLCSDNSAELWRFDTPHITAATPYPPHTVYRFALYVTYNAPISWTCWDNNFWQDYYLDSADGSTIR